LSARETELFDTPTRRAMSSIVTAPAAPRLAIGFIEPLQSVAPD
jgi:hypothetical protein